MAKTEYEPRRTEPNAEFVYNDQGGVRVTARADADGVLYPRSEAEVRLADAFDLPVARKVLDEQKAAAAAKEPKT